MKKTIALLLAVLLISLCACTQREIPLPPDAGQTPVATETPLMPPAKTDGDTENPEDMAVEPTVEPEVKTARLKETADAGQEYQDKFVFLGDSTTYGLKYYGVLNGGKNTTQVWTPSSGTLTLAYWSTATIVYPESGAEITIEAALENKQPEYMLITLGVNGVSFMTEQEFTDCYRELVETVQRVSPDTKVIINSIYPVASQYEHINQINNERITAANGWLEALANEMDVPYLDTYSCLVGDDGFLKNEYQNGDYIHLNETGFGVVLNNLRTHAYEGDSAPAEEPVPEETEAPAETEAPVETEAPAQTEKPVETQKPVTTDNPEIVGLGIYFGYSPILDFTIRPGEGAGYVTLTGVVVPGYLDIDSNCSWSIDNPDVAKITPNGRYCNVEYVAFGNATITFSCFGKTSTCIVRCVPVGYHE